MFKRIILSTALMCCFVYEKTVAQTHPLMGDPDKLNFELYKMNNLVGQGDVSYTGDLNLEIPLLTIPGRHGHDFPIVLKYNSNIGQRQTASWVGLGWDLNVGSVERSVLGRFDEGPLSGGNYGGGNADLRGWTADGHSGLADAVKDQADIYTLNIDGEAHELLPIPVDGPYTSYVTKNFKHWDISSVTDATNLLRSFTVRREDGSLYLFDCRVRVSSHLLSKFELGNLLFNYPYRWPLLSITYPDGATTRVVYSPVSPYIQDHYGNSFVDRNAADAWWNVFGAGGDAWPSIPNFGTVGYLYTWPDTIYTDTHFAVFVHSTPPVVEPNSHDRDKYERTNSFRRLNEIVLRERATPHLELIRVKFEYATQKNERAFYNEFDINLRDTTNWTSEERLNNNQLTLVRVRIQKGANPEGNDDSIPPYEFKYGPNPRVNWLAQMKTWAADPNFPGTHRDPVFGSAWRLKELVLPTGGKIRYTFERLNTGTYKAHLDPEGRTVADVGANPDVYSWTYKLAPRGRLVQKEVFDPVANLTQIFVITYGDVVLDPPSKPIGMNFVPRISQMDYFSPQEWYKFYRSCVIGHRWARIASPDGSWKKVYFTSGTFASNRDPRESYPDAISTFPLPPAGSTIITSNAPKRGLVWKTETPYDSTVNIYSFASREYINERFEYFNLYGQCTIYNYRIREDSYLIQLDTTEVWKDGVHLETHFAYNPQNGLPYWKEEVSDLFRRVTRYNYAYLLYPEMEALGMHSQLGETLVYQDFQPLQIRATTWAVSNGKWYPKEEWEQAHGGMIKVLTYNQYDTYGNILKTTDGNGAITRYYYGSHANPFSQVEAHRSRLTGYIPDAFPDAEDGIHKTSFKYDQFGNITEIKDENQKVWTYEYDPLGRLKIVKGPGAQKLKEATYAYGASTVPSTITQRLYRTSLDSAESRYYYDGIGYEVQRQTRIGSEDIITHTKYDAMRRPLHQFKPYQENVAHTYDGSYLSHAISYYQNVEGVGDSPFLRNDYLSDGSGRLRRQFAPGLMFGDSTLGHFTKYTYGTNASGEIVSQPNQLFKTTVEDENGIKTIEYRNKLGHVVATLMDPDSLALTTRFEVDALGRVTSVTAPNGLVSVNQYNPRGQVVQKTTPDAGTVEYLYDDMGNLRLIQDNAHASTEYNNVLEQGTLDRDDLIEASLSQPLYKPGRVSILVMINAVETGDEAIILKIKALNGTTLYSVTAMASEGSTKATGSIILPKGEYAYSVETFNSGSGADYCYEISCQSGIQFAYQKYDLLRRVTEVGEFESNMTMSYFTQANASNTSFPLSNRVLSRAFVYDVPSFDPVAAGQQNLSGKLSYAHSYRLGELAWSTFYSYDSFGRVEWVVQKPASGSSAKKILYTYDLQGNTTRKSYTDASSSNNLHTYYEYDQAGRLSRVLTATGNDTLPGQRTVEALYSYMANGQPKRVQLANSQGVDYKYNERDWLKQINHQNLNTSDDPGHDGPGGSGVPYVDKFGMVVGYYDADAHIGCSQPPLPQYNGNIAWTIYNMSGVIFNGGPAYQPTSLVGYSFLYDRGNRLRSADFGFYAALVDPDGEGEGTGCDWRLTNAFDVKKYVYDAVGNMDSLVRYGSNGTVMDQFKYHYAGGTNKLNYVTDPVPAGAFASDIDNQDPDNYVYDANGNMQHDLANGIGFVLYDMHNLPVTLYKTNGTQYQFAYDAQGNRVRKAQGTATYPMYFNGADGKTEVVVASVISSTYNMWGSDMLGQLKRSPSGWSRYYYLKDHLGNIRVTVDASGNVTGADDYYPFGMQMEGRSIVGSADARYKFTGKERDIETGYDYFGARYYGPRIARWLSVDPLAERFPSESPYCYTGNNPITRVDRDGKAWETILDVISVGYSAYELITNPSWSNAGALALDIAGAAIPFVPATGSIRMVGKLFSHGDEVASGANAAANVVEGGADATKVVDKAAEGKTIAKEGIYEFPAASGKEYVGQSGNIQQRLDKHVQSGKLPSDATGKVKTQEVKGGKTQREIAEQKKIDEKGGIKSGNLENKRNPIGENRKHLLDVQK